MPYIYFLSKRVYSLLGKFNFGTLGDAYRPAKISAAVRRRSPSTKVGTALYSPPPISSAAPHFFTTPYAQKLAIKCTTNGIRNAFFEICFIFHKEAVVVNKSLLAWKLNFQFLVELHSRSHLFFPWHALSKAELEG